MGAEGDPGESTEAPAENLETETEVPAVDEASAESNSKGAPVAVAAEPKAGKAAAAKAEKPTVS